MTPMPTPKPWIAGFSFSHNGSVCLIHGDEIVAAVQEERLNRQKRATLPYGILNSLAFHYCLQTAGIDVWDIELFVVAHNGKYLSTEQKARMVGLPSELEGRAVFMPHYLAHAHAAFAMSGFEESTILVIDGLGESLAELERGFPHELSPVRHAVIPRLESVRTDPNNVGEIVGIYRAEGTTISLLEKHIGGWLFGNEPLQAFGSFGAMFSSVAKLVFGDDLEAGKVMGLAPYGRAEYASTDFVDVSADGQIMFRDEISRHFHDCHEGWPANKIAFENLAYGVQSALELGLSRLVERCRVLGATNDLCYTGGVALNSVANEKVISRRFFNRHFVLPASEDSGLAVGAAYYGLWKIAPKLRGRPMTSDAIGRSYAKSEILRAAAEMPYVQVVDCEDPLDTAVESLIGQEVLGWFQGRSELGPRALGHRSILVDPRSAEMKDIVNDQVKHRESFRPFAPVVLREELSKWFEVNTAEPDSPFMLRVIKFRESVRARVPAVVHVDGTGRVQSLDEESNPPLRRLLELFFERTGVPMLLNTSFNMAGEPIVESPSDALWCMLFTGIDLLVLENVLVRKHPEFQHALDLVPVRRVKEETVTHLSSDGRVSLRAKFPARSGRQTFKLTGDSVEAFALCNDGQTGWQILDLIGSRWNEIRLLRALARLRAARIIELVPRKEDG
jgi:carbamoyltransferase